MFIPFGSAKVITFSEYTNFIHLFLLYVDLFPVDDVQSLLQDIDGKVGEIDGIKYKIIGAHNNNVDIVFVPEKNYKEAVKIKKKNKYKMKIIKVKNFTDAVNYLKK